MSVIGIWLLQCEGPIDGDEYLDDDGSQNGRRLVNPVADTQFPVFRSLKERNRFGRWFPIKTAGIFINGLSQRGKR
ncbi:unnamed protein product [Ambrosiozyma monospora]|uniref:Unnamed protein product n=1 Tax=Ambrosiozyma monospora TaxID=43982 RepID=A0ACB5T2N2_AMBMO|nr:unnamed protein product [Ambrosiozyma monospora]